MSSSWLELSPADKLVNTSSLEPRAYQIDIARGIFSGRNTLVILPTGLGKTLIAIFAMANALQKGKKALILAPTKPLSEQHYESLVKLLNVDKEQLLLLTGSITGSKRAKLESEAKVIAATPQTISNDLRSARLSLEDFGVVIFDECHRAVGRYAYTHIADECKENGVQLVGLTASPGSNRKKIDAIVEALGIENIEIRISSDPDVEPYVFGKNIETLYVDKSPAIDSALRSISPVIDEHLMKLYQKGLSYSPRFERLPKGRILEIGEHINKLQAKNYKFAAMFDFVYVLNLTHAYDLLSSEGLFPFADYFESLGNREKRSRAVNNILANQNVMSAIKIVKEAMERGEEHPKMFKVIEILNDGFRGKNAIVFTQYRSTAKRLTTLLNSNGIPAALFVGKKEGVTQAEQQRIISDFRDGKFRVLVATSIAEEGLDIPSVDVVVFYEPIPSEIRNIQRRGRAGRMRFGEIAIMVAKGTKDEIYLMISRMREKKMRDIVARIKRQLENESGYGTGVDKGQRKLI
jgi:Fanconi anemia group M protein